MNTMGEFNACRLDKVAIIGAACRFPGGSDCPETFFANMLGGAICVSEIPEDRWSNETFFNERDVPGKSYVSKGHFLRNYDYKAFDAEFFGLSPREAEFLDPQQRLLLELAWEAMESAGLDVEGLAGSATGVFVGGFTLDHLLNQLGSSARDGIGTHSAAGATLTMLSNRISYAFDLCGPSLSIDTACSSSLVAFAQGVTAVLTGQCEMALVGGANFILRPEYMIAMSKGRFLAKDGRSKSFDSRADGYGRGEGGGVVVLKSYDAALRDGDEILAVVDGSGVNQDGRTSGITVPNPEAQRQLMVRVLEESGLTATEIDYIEAHGTGTAVGDPRETSAIADVYGTGGSCIVGSVKANIGHLEAAAGIASVIKTTMMLRHNKVPPVAGLVDMNPSIPSTVVIPREVAALSPYDAQRRIAINSFGYGGTNAHVILSSPDVQPFDFEDKPSANVSAHVLPLSARDSNALLARATQFADLLERSGDDELDDILFTAGARRTHMAHRMAVYGESRDALAEALRNYAAQTDFCGVEDSRSTSGKGRIAFVYTGMGPQWWGMGRDLLRENAVFRETLEQTDALFTRIAGFSILEEMTRDEADSQIKRTEFAQPANLMIQIGLTEALRAEGIVADAVVGHSVGEVASGWASGMLSLEEALLVSRERSRTQAKTAGQGGMLALGLSAEAAAEAIAPYADLVSLAAINSPRSVTVAGNREALDAIRVEAEGKMIFARALEVEVPYHSPLMEPLKPELRDVLASLDPKAPAVPLYSTVTGGLIGEGEAMRGFDAEYWCDNVRDPVRFADAINALMDDGYTLFLEVGPHPVLRRSLEEIAAARNVEARTCSTLAMNKPETAELRRAVCEVYAKGGRIDWAARTPGGRQRALPAYPWQRQTLWREADTQSRDRLVVQPSPMASNDGEVDLNLRRLNYLFDHVVDGAPIMPAAGYLEALAEEARRRWPECKGLSLRDVTIERALVLDHERSLRLSVRFDPTAHRAELLSHEHGVTGEPVLHATASIFPDGARPSPLSVPMIGESNAIESLDPTQLYADLAQIALQYGPAFRPIVALRRDASRGLAEARLVRPEIAGEQASAYVLHPALLDGCFQTALTLIDTGSEAYLPVSLAALEIYAGLPEEIICRAHLAGRTAAEIVCDFELTDLDGAPLARIKGLVCRSLHGRGKANLFPAGDYQRVWNRLAEPAPAALQGERLLIVAEAGDALADSLATGAEAKGHTVDRCAWRDVPELSGLREAARVIGFAPEAIGTEVDRTGETAVVEMLAAMQAMIGQYRKFPVRVVTRSAQAVTANEDVAPAHSAVAGFLRVARNEMPTLEVASIDVPAESALAHVDALLAEALADQRIDEVALRGSERHAAVMAASGLLQMPQVAHVDVAGDHSIEFTRHAGGFSAALVPAASLRADSYEVKAERIAVRLDRPEEPVGFVGVVTRCGPDATRLAPGDRVAGLAPHRIANRLHIDDLTCVVEKVAGEAGRSALLPSIAAPAAALADQAAPDAGDCALVVEGRLGDAFAAELSARGLVVTRVAADLEGWDGPLDDGGFDVIAGPLGVWSHAMGFFALAQGGTLVDLGEDSTPFALPGHCRQLVRVHGDLALLHDDRRYRQALARVLGAPVVSDDARTVGCADLVRSDALELIGTDWVELDLASETRPIAVATADMPVLDPAGVYLVTGGFSGLGRAVALWLAEHGAGRIALVGRRGIETPGAPELLESLRAMGAECDAHPLDVSDAAAVTMLLEELHSEDAPLRGIFHAAGVIDDQPLRDLTGAQIEKIMRPKAGGAWALHAATVAMGIELDQFVLFSSIANLVGNSRQANYCAANGFLDGLAHHRHANGLAALSVNFGAIAGTGMLEGDERVGQHLTQIGLAPLDVNVALAGLGRALSRGVPQVAIAEKIAWEKWAAYETVGGTSPAFRELVEESRAAKAGAASLVDQLHEALAGLDDEAALGILCGLIAEVVAAGLKTNAERLKPDQTFDSFGVDSLMTTEIQIQLDASLGVAYSVVELLGSTTIAKLADKALSEIRAKALGLEFAA